jgi:hypothetical protein
MMSFIDLKFLILAQIGIDIAIIAVFIFLIMRFRSLRINQSLNRGVQLFDSLLTDADRLSGDFRVQLEEKQQLIRSLNEQLDRRILSLNILLSRADALLGSESSEARDLTSHRSPSGQEKEIIKLAEEGHDPNRIAQLLSLSKGEVKLVLDLKTRLTKIGSKEGVP